MPPYGVAQVKPQVVTVKIWWLHLTDAGAPIDFPESMFLRLTTRPITTDRRITRPATETTAAKSAGGTAISAGTSPPSWSARRRASINRAPGGDRPELLDAAAADADI